MNEILIVTVNFKNTIPTKSLVASLEQCHWNEKIKLVVVDNESSNNTRTELKSITENSIIDIQILPSENNRYYWGGAAFAIEKVDMEHYKWIIICNNDVTFNDPQFFSHLNEINIENYPIIGPRIQSTVSNKDLNPFLSNSISTIQDIYYSLYYSNVVTAKFVHKIGRFISRILVRHSLGKRESKIEYLSAVALVKEDQKSKIKRIYAPHGSCMIFSNKYFSNGGYLDTGFAMYGEEISTAEIAKSIDLSIHYIPTLSLTHDDHQSTSKSSWKENFLHSKTTYYYIKNKYRS